MKSVAVASATVLVVLMTSAASAATQRRLGAFGDWSAWTYSSGKRKGCFIYANPRSVFPRTLDHGLVSFFIRSTTRKDMRSEASLQLGYDQSPKAKAKVEIDGKTFRLETEKKGAWLAKAREAEILKAMKSGRRMAVSTRSERGNKTRYVFSLKGVTDAMRLMRKQCP